jgi:hypothetical protein
MKILISIFVIICLASCESKADSNIEIYLVKDRKAHIDGLNIVDVQNFAKKEGINLSEFDYPTTFDTLTKTLYFASNFKYSTNDLENQPFIKNDEFESLDIEKGIIRIRKDGGLKILKLKPNLRNGRQFVITINKEPVMNGYFYNPYSSNGSTWYTIQYDDFKTVNNTILKSYEFSFFKGDGTSNKSNRKEIKFDNYPKLIKALQKSGRLIGKVPPSAGG